MKKNALNLFCVENKKICERQISINKKLYQKYMVNNTN